MDFILDEEFRQANRKHTKQERLNLERLIEDEGCHEHALTVALIGDDRILIDGYNTYDICKEKGIAMTPPRCLLMKDREEALDWMYRKQRGRRNLSEKEMTENRVERMIRVAAARRDGQSTRAIAEEEGVSQTTVLDDLAKSGEHPLSPDTSTETGKVKGIDGKIYAAKNGKPLCDRCAGNIRIGKEAVRGCDMCKQLRPGAAPRVVKQKDAIHDPFGVEVPKACRDAWADPWIQTTIDLLGATLAKLLEARLADGMNKRAKHYPFFHAKDFISGLGTVQEYLEKVLDHLKDERPAGVCPSCDGAKCGKCRQSGLVPKAVHKEFKAKGK